MEMTAAAETGRESEGADRPGRCAGRGGVWRRWLGRVVAGTPAWVVLLPVLVVLWRAALPAGEAWEQVVENRLAGHLWQTLVLAVSVSALAIVLGVPAAWLVSVYRFPGVRAFGWLLMLPLAMPGFIAALAYLDLLQGMIPVYVWIRNEWGIEAFLASQRVAPWVFAVAVLGATLSPYVFLSCRAVFAVQAAGALEASRMLGAGGLRSFFGVGLPMARPAVAAGASLVAMEAVNDYGVVALFGLTPLTPGIFRAWMEGSAGVAMRLAVILMVVVFLLLWLERGQRGRRRFAEAAGGEAPLARRALGPAATLLAWLCCGLPLVLGFGLPALRLVLWSWQSWEGHDWVGHWQAAGRSFGLAAGAAGLIVAGALLLVGALRADPCGSTRWARRIGVTGYAFPSALVAVGVGAWVGMLAGPLPMLALSASVFGLMAAYFIRYLAVGVQPLAAGFDRTPPDFHEAARSLGSRALAALGRVDFPLVWPAILAGATLAFLDVFKELPLTLALRPFDFETLATRAYRLTDEGRIPEAALPGLALVCLSLAGLIPLTRMLRQPS